MYRSIKVKYSTEKKKLDDLVAQKDKLASQMNGLMVGFEDSKEQKVALLGGYLRDKYKRQYQIKFGE